MPRRLLVPLLSVVLIAVPMSGRAARASEETVNGRFRVLVAQKAAEAGVDASVFLDATSTVTTYDERGVAHVSTRPFGEVLDALAPSISADVADADGPAGTPEVLAGNTTALFLTAFAGSTDDAQCQSVTATRSAVAPDAPFVPVTAAPLLLTPVPGALEPVIPASSWILPAYVAGGPVQRIKASYTYGLHTVGTLIGSGLSTAPGAPAPSPVWLPMAHSVGFVEDHSIDFVGHVLGFTHAEFRLDLFGYTICGGAGALPLSDGVAIFDNHEVAGTQVDLPDVP